MTPWKTRASARIARLLLLACWAVLAAPSWGFISDPAYGSINSSWNGVGDVADFSGSQCVISTEDNPPKDGPGEGKKKKYFLSVSIAGETQFVLHKTDAGDTIPFALSYSNGKGPSEPILVPGASNGPFDGGDVKKCGVSSRFEILVAELDLRGMPAGDYRAILAITHTNEATGETGSGTLVISLRITAQAIALTALDNIDLGTWDGVAATLSAGESFCVSGTAYQYQITARGEAGGFTLSNGVDTIVYEVRFAQGTDASAGQALLVGVPVGTYPLVGQCTGDNAAMFIQTLTPLSSSSSGAYFGQLTLTVEPP